MMRNAPAPASGNVLSILHLHRCGGECNPSQLLRHFAQLPWLFHSSRSEHTTYTGSQHGAPVLRSTWKAIRFSLSVENSSSPSRSWFPAMMLTGAWKPSKYSFAMSKHAVVPAIPVRTKNQHSTMRVERQ